MGRIPTCGRRKQLKRLTERHREICRRTVLGEIPSKIARDLGVSKSLISLVRGSAVCQEYIQNLEWERDMSTINVAEQLREMAPEALAVLQKALRGEVGGSAQDTTMMKAAVEILDRSGFSKVNKVQGHVQHCYFDLVAIEEIKRRGRECMALDSRTDFIEVDVGLVNIDENLAANGELFAADDGDG